MLLLFSPPFSSVCPTLWSFGNLSLTNSPETTRMCSFSGQKGQMPGSLILQVESHHAIRIKHRNQWQLLSTIIIIQDDPVNLQPLQETHMYPHHICTNTQTYTLMLTHHIKALKGHGSVNQVSLLFKESPSKSGCIILHCLYFIDFYGLL